ncbi:hypothetical protein WJX73_007066 [Symbiochloris irregularis]|uniref:C3H1-type domain-containing protein n=1 Tax=Symbiochloris irregularis TaxID=706552 RepID=A0AAW1NMS0_9CHLO
MSARRKGFKGTEENRNTKMCERWKQGSCNYGNRCNFAHGADNLRKHPQRSEASAAAAHGAQLHSALQAPNGLTRRSFLPRADGTGPLSGDLAQLRGGSLGSGLPLPGSQQPHALYHVHGPHTGAGKQQDRHLQQAPMLGPHALAALYGNGQEGLLAGTSLHPGNYAAVFADGGPQMALQQQLYNMSLSDRVPDWGHSQQLMAAAQQQQLTHHQQVMGSLANAADYGNEMIGAEWFDKDPGQSPGLYEKLQSGREPNTWFQHPVNASMPAAVPASVAALSEWRDHNPPQGWGG